MSDSSSNELVSHKHGSTCAVGIGIPVRNEGETLECVLRAALNQTHRNINVVVSDNMSTDGSQSITHRFVQRDSRVRVVEHSAPIPVVENFESALRAASEQSCFVMWLGGHDLIPRRYVELLLDEIVKQEFSLAVPSQSLHLDKSRLASLAVGDTGFSNELPVHSLLRMDDASFVAKHVQLRTIVEELGDCTAFHGLWDVDFIGQVRILNVVASDHAVLFEAASMGRITSANVVYLRGAHGERGPVRSRYQAAGIAVGPLAPLKLGIRHGALVIRSPHNLKERYRLAIYCAMTAASRRGKATRKTRLGVQALNALSLASRVFGRALLSGSAR